MGYTSPAAQSSGAVAPVSWATAVKAALDYLANPPACRAYHNAAQSVANNSPAVVAFNSERYDTDTMHDTVTNNSRVTLNTAGLYSVTAHGSFASNATGNRYIAIKLNGSIYIAVDLRLAASGQRTDMSIATIYKFAAGDYITVEVYQNSGGALSLDSVGNYTPELAATWIGTG